MLVGTFKDRGGLVGDFWFAYRWNRPGFGCTQGEVHHEAFRSAEEALDWLGIIEEDYGEADEAYVVYVSPASVEYLGVATEYATRGPMADIANFAGRANDIREAIEAYVESRCELARKYVALSGGKQS